LIIEDEGACNLFSSLLGDIGVQASDE
jgi:hypothetical protein